MQSGVGRDRIMLTMTFFVRSPYALSIACALLGACGGSTAPDGADASGAGDGGQASDAGDAGPPGPCTRDAPSVPCSGVGPCTGATTWCCTALMDPTAPSVCIAPGATCSIPSDAGGYPIDLVNECDDVSDCPVGTVCCSHYNKGLNTSTTSCDPSCSASGYASQVCHKDCECTGGTKCNGGYCN